MTTPSREEAPEHVWLDPMGASTWILRHGPGAEAVEYLRADLANREPSEGDVERAAKAIGREETGLDDESLDGLVWHPSSNSWRVPDMPRWKQWEEAALAAIEAYRSQP